MRSVFVAFALAGCTASAPVGTPQDAARDAVPGDTSTPPPDEMTAPTGNLSVTWMHGSANCNQNNDPELQQHAFTPTTFIFRQNKCDTFEAPFIYLLVGDTRALLLDTGATNTPALRTAVRAIIGTKPLVVAHTHAHGDHVAGDPQFRNQANTTLVGTSINEVRAAFGITATSTAAYDLGGRMLDVFAIPGHHGTHIAIYDRTTRVLLTGDTVYPGLLFINDWTSYRASIDKLATFATTNSVSYVLGAHVEMTATPRQVYPYGTTYQPSEHVLQLAPADLTSLDTALDTLGPNPPNNDVPYDHFIVAPQ